MNKNVRKIFYIALHNMSRGQLRKSSINCVIVIALFVTVLHMMASESSQSLTLHINATNISDTSCYYEVFNDKLPLLDKTKFSPSFQSIFFHEVSCKGGFDSRQACTVESAARNNPNWEIYVFFTGPVEKSSLESGNMQILKSFNNVKFYRIFADKYSSVTNLEHSFKGDNLQRFTIYQINDALKYLSLKKWGGIAMDLDMLTLKSFDDHLPSNFAARVSDAMVGDAIIAISRDELGRNISRVALQLLQSIRKENYHKIITRALKKICSTDEVYYMNSDKCNGFEIYPSSSFYPIPFSRWHRYYIPRDLLVTGYPDDVFTHYLWNALSGQQKVPKNSLYADLARMCCPSVYKLYGDDFGF